MGFAFCLVVLYILTASTTASSAGGLLSKRMEVRGEDGNDYVLSISKKLDEEDVDLLDSDGNKILTTEFFNKEGYYIQKPVNQDICNLVQIEEKEDDKPLCYRRQEVSKQNLTDKVLDHCRDRKIYVLITDNARCPPAEANAREDKSTFDEKRKRSVDIGYLSGRYICKTETIVTSIRYCCGYFRWWCSTWCNKYTTKMQTICFKTS